MPTQPTGMSFMHIMAGGLLLGLAVPLGLLFIGLQLDPRLRVSGQLIQQHKLPLLGVVPHFYAPSETLATRREVQQLALVFAGTIAVLVSFALLRLFNVV